MQNENKRKTQQYALADAPLLYTEDDVKSAQTALTKKRKTSKKSTAPSADKRAQNKSTTKKSAPPQERKSSKSGERSF